MKKAHHSRRSFMGLAGSGVAGLLSGGSLGSAPAYAAAPDTQDADLVVFNAKVYPVDSRAPPA